LLALLWQTAEERRPAAALTALSARVRPRWDPIIQALSAAQQRIHRDVHGGSWIATSPRGQWMRSGIC
jgi:hypothetical protein